jgi:hypothetical protein
MSSIVAGPVYSVMAKRMVRNEDTVAFRTILDDCVDPNHVYHGDDHGHLNESGVTEVAGIVRKIADTFMADVITSDSCLCVGSTWQDISVYMIVLF